MTPEDIKILKEKGFSQDQIEYFYFESLDDESLDGLSTVSLENPSTVDYGFFEGSEVEQRREWIDKIRHKAQHMSENEKIIYYKSKKRELNKQLQPLLREAERIRRLKIELDDLRGIGRGRKITED